MNYLKIYCNLIRKAEKRTPPEGYTEKHHTFPKSIFGKNKRVVVLTAREHYIAHALLEKAFIKRYGLNHIRTQKMIKAFWCMNNQKSKNTYLNSYLYESSRKTFLESIKGENSFWYGRKHTLETRKKMSKAQTGEKHSMYGKKHSPETKTKMSKSQKGKPSPKGMLGKNHSEEAKQKIREQKEVKSFCIISSTGEIICDKNAKEFCRKNNLDKGHFSQVLNGKRKSHKGFRLYLGEDT